MPFPGELLRQIQTLPPLAILSKTAEIGGESANFLRAATPAGGKLTPIPQLLEVIAYCRNPMPGIHGTSEKRQALLLSSFDKLRMKGANPRM